MTSPLAYLAVAVLVAHGLVHLLGTAVYLQFAEVAEFSYKTTLLGGRIDVGEAGIRVFGVLWAVAAAGFVAAGGGLLADWRLWRPLLLAVTVLSLVLTALDFTVAYAGVVVDLAILASLVVSMQL